MKLKKTLVRSTAILFAQMVVSTIVLSMGSTVYARAERGDIAGEMQEFQRNFSVVNGRRFLMDGINCHGTSLHAAGLINYPTYVDDREMNFILDNYCQKVSRPGRNTVATWDRNTRFPHSYFHRTSTTIIEKRGLVRREPIQYKNRSFVRRAEYFRCSQPQLSCPDLNVLKNRIHILGLYFANLSIGKAWPTHTQAYLRFARRQQQNLARFRPNTEDCGKTKRILQHRLDSLTALANNTGNGGFMMQQIPQGNKL